MSAPLKLVRTLVALGVFCISLEFWARMDDYLSYGAPLSGAYNSEILYTRDSLGRLGKPNARYRKWRLNEIGFRGPSMKADRINILTFGASETFGLYEGEGREYPRGLERKLNERTGTQAFQVVNVALPGESAFTAALRAPRIVDIVRPRIALVYAAPADYIWLPYLSPSVAPATSTASPRFELRLTERVRTFAKSIIPQVVQNRLREREIQASESAATVVMDRLPEENVRRFHDDVTLLVTTLRARGVIPVVVTHANAFGPTLTDDDRRLLTSWRKFYPELKEEGFLDMERRMNDALRAIAAEQGISLIDVAREIPANRQNFADFVHFTDQGADIMADRLAIGLLPIAKRQLQGPSTRSSSE
ncbi:MAG: hypothetical protein JWL61_2723 [Gemmatimonadetes bacterium]|nr:hypothetical protein [Gemmatimonadota bacterium]